MAITEIIRFSSDKGLDEAVLREVIESLRESKRARHESVGTGVQASNTVQIIAEWDDDHQIHPGWSHIVDNVKDYLGQPSSVFHVALSEPILGPDGPATSSVVEFAANYFPASRITDASKLQIEEDFLKFNDIAKKGLKGAGGVSYGWVVEEQLHPDSGAEKAACFIIIRGWESYDHFQSSLASEEFKAAIPILLAWRVPHEMVRT